MAQPEAFAQCLRSLLRETEDLGDDLAERRTTDCLEKGAYQKANCGSHSDLD
jgi:hypothetical protein